MCSKYSHGLIEKLPMRNCGQPIHVQRLPVKLPQDSLTPVSWNFTSKPIDRKISFEFVELTSIPAPNKLQVSPPSTNEIPATDDLNSLNKTLYVPREFVSIFLPLGRIDTVYKKKKIPQAFFFSTV
ncbi:hypothetical protein CDAR_201841 [Caerostris darwini]|uniref:Uncharacterized protein n=1 Tax=Caerostris darwini TaxID=1538125 RepID=A0AAV4WNH4_9ARAC|nr:hypothetical protein CDAR_201841 [Caerostris darwini]